MATILTATGSRRDGMFEGSPVPVHHTWRCSDSGGYNLAQTPEGTKFGEGKEVRTVMHSILLKQQH